MPKKRDVLTIKQHKLLKGISENLADNKGETMQAIALKAGYKASSAKVPVTLLRSKPVQKRLQAMLATMDTARSLHLAEMMKPEKVESANMRDNAYVFDILVKNQRLLSGESTSNTAINIQISEAIAEKNDEKPA